MTQTNKRKIQSSAFTVLLPKNDDDAYAAVGRAAMKKYMTAVAALPERDPNWCDFCAIIVIHLLTFCH